MQSSDMKVRETASLTQIERLTFEFFMLTKKSTSFVLNDERNLNWGWDFEFTFCSIDLNQSVQSWHISTAKEFILHIF